MLKSTLLFTESCDNTTHIDNASKQSKLETTQIKTKKDNEHGKPSNDSLTNNNGKFIKDLSKRTLTHLN